MVASLGRRILPCLIGAGLVAACSDGSAPTGGSQGSLSFASGTGAPAPAAAVHPLYSAAPISVNGQTLAISQVELVLAEVELKQADHAGLCSGEGPGCEEFEAGPALVDLPLGGGVISPFSSPVAQGTYSEAELKVDVPSEDDAATTAFLAAHPTWPQTASVHVVGTFDANDGSGPQAFDVYLSTEAELELAFNPPVVVDASGAFNVTVAIDPNAWFTASGGALIDPRALATDSSLSQTVADNIKNSFHAFDDDDKDGLDD